MARRHGDARLDRARRRRRPGRHGRDRLAAALLPARRSSSGTKPGSTPRPAGRSTGRTRPGASDFALRLTPAGLAAFNAEIQAAAIERYRADGRPSRPTPPTIADRSSVHVLRLPARGRRRDDGPRRAAARAGATWSSSGCAGCRPACSSRSPCCCPVARAVADRDRSRVQPPGPRRAGPRAADRRPVRRARPAAGAHRRRAWSGSPRSGLLYVADSVAMFAAAVLLQGVYRALDSGPLEAWYVDATLAADPDAGIERGLSAGSTVLSLAIAVGALAVRRARRARSVRRHPDARPADPRRARARRGQPHRDPGADERGPGAPVASRPWPPRSARCRSVIGDGIGLLRASRVLLRSSSVELFWGFAMVTFESLFPIRLSETLGDTDQAAALMGPVSSVAWFASARGAAGVVLISKRIGVARSAAGAADRAGRDDRGDGPRSPARRAWSSRISPATSPTARRTRCT